jgi:sulfite exporter TauE/SafE/copper chaperone CopZ
MRPPMTRQTVLVQGMSCAACEQRIERALSAVPGVRAVKASAPRSEVTFEAVDVAPSAVDGAIRGAGYQPIRGGDPAGSGDAVAVQGTGLLPVVRFVGLAVIVAGFAIVLRYVIGFSFLPSISQKMAYGVLFLAGLVTSLHCVAMCGGIALTQGMPAGVGARGVSRFAPSLLYNAGRVVSYTIIGGIAGGIGSLFSLSPIMKAVIPLLAGAFMVFLGIRMLGVFPALTRMRIRLPGLAGDRLRKNTARLGPFGVGLLNGLMPCGPLQTMQVYALGTGSLLAGAFSLFVFAGATVPLMLGFGAASSLLSRGFTKNLFKVSGALVLALGAVMLVRSAGLFGLSMPAPSPKGIAWIAPTPARLAGGLVPLDEIGVARQAGAVQSVEVRVDTDGFHPAVLVLQGGLPARIRFIPAKLDARNRQVAFPGYPAQVDLGAGAQDAEFPDVLADFTFRGGTNEVHGYVKVVEDIGRVDLKAVRRQVAAYRPAGACLAACCGY